jgi:hypothetical protein
MKNTLTCFGVGDGGPCADRNHASFLYRLGKATLLIDCGEPVDRSLKSTSLSYDSVDGILLSHMHSDHVGGIFMLMQGFWLEGRKRELPVYLPGGAAQPLRRMLEAVLLFDGLIGFRLKFIPLISKKRLVVNGVRVTSFPTTHLDGLRRRFGKKQRADFSSYCFLLESGGLRIGHSADLGRPEDLDPLMKKPLDLLVCELSHFSPDKIMAYLAKQPVKQVVFVHLAGRHYRNRAGLRRLAAKELRGIPCDFPADGAVIKL